MGWTKILEREIYYTYGAADTLMEMVDEAELDWRPPVPEGAQTTGWMTVGQLLQHMTTSCGFLCQAFLKNDWSFMPEPSGQDEVSAPVEAMPSAPSVQAARDALAKDREVATAAIHEAGDERMDTEMVKAPWGIEATLGEQYLDMVRHLGQHKSQLFYYLKLLGRPVHTGHLWGLE